KTRLDLRLGFLGAVVDPFHIPKLDVDDDPAAKVGAHPLCVIAVFSAPSAAGDSSESDDRITESDSRIEEPSLVVFPLPAGREAQRPVEGDRSVHILDVEHDADQSLHPIPVPAEESNA